ncbi:hypothetical protein BRAS3843_1270039 [Bradyrhizobium sp. STM 3843]|nr:hypothetical protein BRAS3843_1270039 [Bradyrhizobium sp. STM 3843]
MQGAVRKYDVVRADWAWRQWFQHVILVCTLHSFSLICRRIGWFFDVNAGGERQIPL